MPQRYSGLLPGLPEERLDRLKAVFEDVRQTLALAWVGELFETLATYDLYLLAAWQQLKPSTMSAYFARVTGDLHDRALAAAVESGLPFSDHERAVRELVGSRKVEPVRAAVEALQRVNASTLLIATALREALLGREVGALPPRTGPDAVIRDAVAPPRLRWPEPAAGDDLSGPGAQIVSREFLLLGSWPPYLDLLRRELRPFLRSDRYRSAVVEQEAYLIAAVRALPYPCRASGELARSHGYGAGEVADLLELVTALQQRLGDLTLQFAALTIGWQGGNLDGA